MLPALDTIMGHKSTHTFVMGSLMAETPFISPLLFPVVEYGPWVMVCTKEYSIFLQDDFWIELLLNSMDNWITTVGWTFFASSGLSFLTVAIAMSPTSAAGSLFGHSLAPLHRGDIQNFGYYVISTVGHGSYPNTQGNGEFYRGGPTTFLLLHLKHRKRSQCYFF